MMKRAAAKGVLAAFATAVAVLSLVPQPEEFVPGPLPWDKLQHAAAYAALTLLGGHAFNAEKARQWHAAAAAAVAFGGVMELAQRAFTAGRQAEFADLVADAVGAFAAAFVMAALRRRFARQPIS